MTSFCFFTCRDRRTLTVTQFYEWFKAPIHRWIKIAKCKAMSRIKKAVELDQVDEINTVSIRSDATFPNRVRKNKPQKSKQFLYCQSSNAFDGSSTNCKVLFNIFEFCVFMILCGVINTVVLMLHNLNFLNKRSIFIILHIGLFIRIVQTVSFWNKMHLDYPLVYMFHQNNQCKH